MTENRIGESLRKAREQKCKTLAEIAQVTHISPEHLEAIEREDFTSLPPIYVRLHIRTFAEEVGLDPAALLADYERLCPPVEPVPDAAPRFQPIDMGKGVRGARIPKTAGIVVVVVAAVALAALLNHLLSRPAPTRMASLPPSPSPVDTTAISLLPQLPDSIPAALAPEPPALLQARSDSFPALPDSAAGDAPESASDSLSTPDDDERLDTPSVPDSGAAAPDVGYLSPPGGIVVSVSARERVWMQVYTVEDILYYGILQPGEQRTWRDPVGIELKVRNWRDVTLTVGGKPVSGVAPDAQEVKLCITANTIDMLQGREWRLHKGPFEPPVSGEGR